MNTYITAILSVILTTNEVKIGTATINGQAFDLIGLQVVTNRIVERVIPSGPTNDNTEYWTNQSLGPIVATNFVPSRPITNVTFNGSTWLNVKNLVLTNYLGGQIYLPNWTR